MIKKQDVLKEDTRTYDVKPTAYEPHQDNTGSKVVVDDFKRDDNKETLTAGVGYQQPDGTVDVVAKAKIEPIDPARSNDDMPKHEPPALYNDAVAEAFYARYCETVNPKHPVPLPSWSQLEELYKNAWRAVAS